MSPRFNLVAIAILASFAGTALADEQAVTIAQTVLQTTAAKTRGSGGDVILPDGWFDTHEGYQHVRFQRLWNKLPVRGGDSVVTLDPSDVVIDVTETYVPLTISKIPKLHDKDAIVAAGIQFGSDFTNNPSAKLVVYTGLNGYARLAYEVWLTNPAHSRMYTIDAQNGALLDQWDTSEHGGTVDYDFLIDEHCVGPYIGVGTPADLSMHTSQHVTQMMFFKFRPSGETAGLMEADADITGAHQEFELFREPDTIWPEPNYLIGEHHPMFGNNPGFTHALRWMFDPSRDGVSPRCYVSNIGSMDRHNSGGVASRFFYLLGEGTAAKTFSGVVHYAPTCDGSSFDGIGEFKAHAIWGTATAGYMTSLTDYSRARIATLKAAKELYGDGSIEMQTVAKAWSAVGVQ